MSFNNNIVSPDYPLSGERISEKESEKRTLYQEGNFMYYGVRNVYGKSIWYVSVSKL